MLPHTRIKLPPWFSSAASAKIHRHHMMMTILSSLSLLSSCNQKMNRQLHTQWSKKTFFVTLIPRFFVNNALFWCFARKNCMIMHICDKNATVKWSSGKMMSFLYRTNEMFAVWCMLGLGHPLFYNHMNCQLQHLIAHQQLISDIRKKDLLSYMNLWLDSLDNWEMWKSRRRRAPQRSTSAWNADSSKDNTSS